MLDSCPVQTDVAIIRRVGVYAAAKWKHVVRVRDGRGHEMSMDFKNQPIEEVVVAVYFDPPISALHNAHVGMFWERIRHEYPAVQQARIAGPPMEIEPNPSDAMFAMPGYRFVSGDGASRIQIQKNAFAFIWSRSESSEYPRFHEGIKLAFDRGYHLFDEFVSVDLKAGKPSIGFCELACFNTVEQGEFWRGLEDMQRVIPSFSPLSTGVEGRNLGFDCSYIYEISTDLVLEIAVRNMVLDETLLKIDITARGFLGQASKSNADEWFERAHGAVLRCFANMTNPDIRKRCWGMEEETC